jgi:hypothetical protein
MDFQIHSAPKKKDEIKQKMSALISMATRCLTAPWPWGRFAGGTRSATG